MYKKDIVDKIYNILKENKYKKKVNAQKTVFHISDDEGHSTNFVVQKPAKEIYFCKAEIEAILNAFYAVILDGVKHGDEIIIQGIGRLYLKLRAKRQVIHPVTKELMEVSERYVPTFAPAKQLKTAARIYELSSAEEDPVEINEEE